MNRLCTSGHRPPGRDRHQRTRQREAWSSAGRSSLPAAGVRGRTCVSSPRATAALIGPCPRAAAIAATHPVTSIGTTRNPPINPTRRCSAILRDSDESRLEHEQEHPRREQRAVDVEQPREGWHRKEALQVVRASEPEEDRDRGGNRHSHEEPAAVTRLSDGIRERLDDCGRRRCHMHGRDNTLGEMREAMAGRLIDLLLLFPDNSLCPKEFVRQTRLDARGSTRALARNPTPDAVRLD